MNTPIRLSVAIMAIPERRQSVNKMREQLDLGDRKLRISVDEDYMGIWPNARNAWLSYDPDATHHLVLQDDLTMCRDLLAGLEQAIQYIPPEDIVSLVSFRETYERAVRSGTTSWFKAKFLNAPGLVIPTHCIEKMIDWIDRQDGPQAAAR